METSILISTKKVLGVSEDDTSFDTDIITHINSTFGILYQLGIGPTVPFEIDDSGSELWGDFCDTVEQLNLVRTYMFLRVRMLFDPPTLSFLIDAMKQQIQEYETRLLYLKEYGPTSMQVQSSVVGENAEEVT